MINQFLNFNIAIPSSTIPINGRYNRTFSQPANRIFFVFPYQKIVKLKGYQVTAIANSPIGIVTDWKFSDVAVEFRLTDASKNILSNPVGQVDMGTSGLIGVANQNAFFHYENNEGLIQIEGGVLCGGVSVQHVFFEVLQGVSVLPVNIFLNFSFIIERE
jgi:hypothetical protein